MKRGERLPELLAPAGDFECLVAAVRGGADAVYIGGKLFSARAYAKNFDISEIKRAVSYCHLHGVKLYVTMNTLLYERELESAVSFARELYLAGVDALIVADLGFIGLLRKNLPDFELHASTQMSVHNSLGADMAYELGCTRVVLARELSGKNIADVTEKCLAETEVFLHGALCVCHSGQCLFSSMVGGRSGNRGECAQPCRLPYNNGKYILSLSDLSLASHVRELIDSGVASLKIEGRMKSPDYVYTVTSIYRTLLDEYRDADGGEKDKLRRAFSRSGFTDGYFLGDTSRAMTGVRTEEDKRVSKNEEKGDYTPDRVAVKARVRMRLGEPSSIILAYKSADLQPREITAYGDGASPAISSPLNNADVKARLSKMGNTFLSLSVEDIELELDDGVNLPPSAINALRRSAAEMFENFSREESDNATPTPDFSFSSSTNAPRMKRTAVFFSAKTLMGVREGDLSYFDCIFAPLSEYGICSNRAQGVYIPPIVSEDELDEIRDMLTSAKELGAAFALVGNISHIALVEEMGLTPIGDFRLNVFNPYTCAVYRQLGVESTVVSPELNAREAGDAGQIAVTYGRIPLMITERCFIKENFGCDNCNRAALSDRKGISFPMMREYKHRNIIFNSATTYMADKKAELKSSGICAQHYIFTTETPREISLIIAADKSGERFPLGGQFRRMGKRKFE